jgi:hypothetical protein
MEIIYRTCNRIESLHGNNRIPNEVKKEKIIFNCLFSVINSINNFKNFNGKLTIVDDHSDESFLKNIKNLLNDYSNFENEIINLEKTGNGNSMAKCYEIGKYSKENLLLFLEDDYLCFPTMIEELITDYEKITNHMGIDIGMFPCDYPDNYHDERFMKIPSHILLGNERHWRTSSNSTFTFMVSKQSLLNYWNLFFKASFYGEIGISEDNSINQVWQKHVPLFAPIPSLAIHLHQGTESPNVDWKKLWDFYDLKNFGV